MDGPFRGPCGLQLPAEEANGTIGAAGGLKEVADLGFLGQRLDWFRSQWLTLIA